MKGRAGVSVVMLAVGGFLLAFSFAGVGAGSRGHTDPTFVKRRTLRLAGGVVPIPNQLDPALLYDPAAATLEFATCAKLFNYPDKEGSAGTRVIKEVVRRYTVSPDGRTYTFSLKRSFRFQTGQRVTARSFAEAFNRDANPKMESPAQSYLHDIVGADAVIAGKAATISGVRVPGRYRLQIRLTRPIGDLIPRLALVSFCPLLPNTPINPAGIDPPGSGPYYIAERIVNNRIVLKRNRFYRGSRPANVDRIMFTIKSPEACLLATKRDEIDLCLAPAWPPDTWQQLARRYGINKKRFFVKRTLETWFVVFNHDRRAFRGRDQIPLEKAINYAIDRAALVRTVRSRGGSPTDQMLPPALGRNERIYPLRADPRRARRWLGKARYKPHSLVLYWPNPSRDGAQSIAFDLKQIGIDVDVKLFAVDEYFPRIGTRGEPFDLAFLGWQPDYADGAAFFIPLASGRGSNPSYFNDPRVNARINAASLKRGKARRRAWADLDVDLMRDNPPWAPFLSAVFRQFVSKSFGCYVYNPVQGIDLAAACKK